MGLWLWLSAGVTNVLCNVQVEMTNFSEIFLRYWCEAEGICARVLIDKVKLACCLDK